MGRLGKALLKFEYRPEGSKRSCRVDNEGKGILGRGNSTCKGPEVPGGHWFVILSYCYFL